MKRSVLSLLLAVGIATACVPPVYLGEPSIDGPAEVKPHTLIRLQLRDVPEGAAVVWDYPAETFDAQENGAQLLATAPPGRYVVLALVISHKDGKTSARKLRHVVSVQGKPTPDIVDPAKPAPVRPGPKLDARAALCKLRVGSSGCTATVIGPRREDGRWDILTAAHCITGPAMTGTITDSAGKSHRVVRTARDTRADICWLRTVESADLPAYAELSKEIPAVGVKIWHAGFGIDTPGNLERGTVYAAPNSDKQLPMRLSVSSGDSGGGIFREDNNELVANVCCTMSRGAMAPVWGGTSVRASELRPR